MSSEARTFRHKYIATMEGPILRDAMVTIANGRIVAIGNAGRDAYALRNTLLMPGLVNAHAHLDLSLSTCSGATAQTSFPDWLMKVRSQTPSEPFDARTRNTRSVEAGVAESLKFGVTCIGDITKEARWTRAALSAMDRRPRVVSYGEVLGLAKRRDRVAVQLSEATNDDFVSDFLRIGISPHAPYTVDRPGYEQCVAVARERQIQLATHLAESEHEQEFLQTHSGPFRELWERVGAWDEPVDTVRSSPIAFADAIGLLEYPSLIAHVNYCNAEEMRLLAGGNASVVYCPRTHRYFGHPQHRWREMLSAGINVAVGTDSCASSPDLNLLDDLRLLHEIAPDIPPQTLFDMATIRGARALGMGVEVGSITVGKRSDLIAFEVQSDDPLREILETRDMRPCSMWIGDQQIF